MSRKELKKKAVRQVGRIAYGREVGDDTAVMEWRLRQTCRQLAEYGALGEDWWYNLFMEA